MSARMVVDGHIIIDTTPGTPGAIEVARRRFQRATHDVGYAMVTLQDADAALKRAVAVRDGARLALEEAQNAPAPTDARTADEAPAAGRGFLLS